MQQLTRGEAHLILAGIRVLAHLSESTPTPKNLADFLNEGESVVRLRLSVLEESGAVALVKSAFDTHLEIRDYLAIETYKLEDGPAISQDLKEFDERKKAEADKMAKLFADGDHEKKHQQRIDQMDEEFLGFKKKKPINPFGDNS